MSKYSTYILNKDCFTLDPSVSEIKTVTETHPDGHMTYKITGKFSHDATIGEILLWLDAGAEVRVTLPDGSTGTLELKKTVN